MTDLFDVSEGLKRHSPDRTVTLLPDPEPRIRHHTLVSVDDHFIEARDAFVSRVPAHLRDDVPHIVEVDGAEVWEFDGQRLPNVGLSAVVGRPPEELGSEPTRFDEMRKGCWDATARVIDMDISGIAASMNFPSIVPGFAGTKFARMKNREAAIASVRAWNDWVHEDWVTPFPDRFIPCGITYLGDVDEAVAEVRRNAARGFRAVSLPEMMQPAGLPSLYTGHWDPLIAACEETDTAICLHIGSSSQVFLPSDDGPPELMVSLFPVNAQMSAMDWLMAKVPLRFPKIKIVMSEGGLGWVPAMIDRLDAIYKKHAYLTWSAQGQVEELKPSEVLRRNFWFCAIDDPTGFELAPKIGVDHILVEQDYPHADGSWPDSQELLNEQLAILAPEDQEKVTWRNASALFRFPITAI